MKKQKFQISMKDGKKKLVEGYIFNDKFGVDKREPAYYVITHLATGARVWSARTLKECKMLMAEPEFFIDTDDFRVLVPAIARAEQRIFDEQYKKKLAEYEKENQKKGGQIK